MIIFNSIKDLETALRNTELAYKQFLSEGYQDNGDWAAWYAEHLGTVGQVVAPLGVVSSLPVPVHSINGQRQDAYVGYVDGQQVGACL